MQRPLLYLAGIFCMVIIGFTANASHNRAGEITYTWLYGNTYEITVTTYTKVQENAADRCDLLVYWGDQDKDTLLRSNGLFNGKCGSVAGEGVLIADDINKNVYIGQHTYPGPGIYRITMLDPNRNKEVANMQDSFNTPFFIFLTFMIGTSFPDGMDTNSSPVILNPPIDDACSGKLFVHNAGAFDINGDSISYALTKCYEGIDDNVNPPFLVEALGYFTPNFIDIDPVLGDLLWDTPPPITPANDPTGRGFAEYNVCFEIIEWRKGAVIGRIQRDMQITVWPCNNDPPVITAMDTCVLAGQTINISVNAIDADFVGPDSVTLEASGGPFLLSNSPATFTLASSPPAGQANGTLNWQTNCSHVRKQPYGVTFKAEDNHPGPKPEVSLVDYETIGITVIAPAPTGLQSAPNGNYIDLSWDVSTCSGVTAYKIYRRNGSFTGTIDCPCESGVPGFAGYDLLATVTGLNTLNYLDDNNGIGLIHGVDYCYRIVACFADGAESCASVETCSKLDLNVPIITHVSVGTTDLSLGRDTLIWSMQQILDTNGFPGPYHYKIYESPDFNSAAQLIASTPVNDSLQLTDTIYIHNGINTETVPHSYKVVLYSDTEIVGSTHIASSIFLSIVSSDDRLDLSWQANVPWTNTQYFIYRLNDTLNFDLIDSTSTTAFADTGLINGREYCYFIKSVGSYSVTGLIDPIINYSQESCEIPLDKTPPCAPDLVVSPSCDLQENTLTWNNPNNSCADDVMYYNIYYAALFGEELEFLQSVSPATETSLLLSNLKSIAGCYAISAVDSFSNESVLSDSICVDNCPEYSLPNVFSPDGNDLNDYFIPFPYKFVDKINMKIYDRWGQLIFETNDPDVNWDGKYYRNNRDVSEGVFYYIAEVDMIGLHGIVTKTLTGFVHLLRSNPANTN
ncbi:MAG: gliding motility-associated C-terminal domain-containing protein [Flavobacteriales bacterium]|nr:gliding motility-associated C-terminal domain-containing protein [Flavobacteriales bacterium]